MFNLYIRRCDLLADKDQHPVSKWLLRGKSSLTRRQAFRMLFHLASIPRFFRLQREAIVSCADISLTFSTELAAT